MSCSKPLPPFTFDVLCYLNRDQLERFSIVCRPLKNLIDRYFRSKPFRVFDHLRIHEGSYALCHKYVQWHNYDVQWHPNRGDYSVQQFLDGQKCGIDIARNSNVYYSFAEMRPYLGPTVRIKQMRLYPESTYSLGHIEEMESIAYLWREGDITIFKDTCAERIIVAEDFQLILNSPMILQCRELYTANAQFSFKDYKVLYSVKVIIIFYDEQENIDFNYWPQFLEQPGVKPIVVFRWLEPESVDDVLGHLSKAFSSAVSPNAFKIVFAEIEDESDEEIDEPLTEFRKTNNTSGEILELKKGVPLECQSQWFTEENCFTLERSSI